METKLLKVVMGDRTDTVIATRINPDEDESGFLKQAGYHSETVFMMSIASGQLKAQYDPYGWGVSDRLRFVAHGFLQDHWDRIKDGSELTIEEM